MAHGTEIDLSAVNGADDEVDATALGVEHGAELIEFAEAAMGLDEPRLREARAEAHRLLGDAAFVDCCAVIASFNVVDRVADSTGIPLDTMLAESSREVRSELDLGRFASSANTKAP